MLCALFHDGMMILLGSYESLNDWVADDFMMFLYTYVYTHIFTIFMYDLYMYVYICMYVPSHCNFLHIVQWVKGEFSTSEFSQSYGAICIFNPSAVRQCG